MVFCLPSALQLPKPGCIAQYRAATNSNKASTITNTTPIAANSSLRLSLDGVSGGGNNGDNGTHSIASAKDSLSRGSRSRRQSFSLHRTPRQQLASSSVSSRVYPTSSSIASGSQPPTYYPTNRTMKSSVSYGPNGSGTIGTTSVLSIESDLNPNWNID